MDFEPRYNYYLNMINKFLEENLYSRNVPEKTIRDAMIYSLMAGGKRIRPVLSLAVCDMLGGDFNEVIPYACGIEMIHTYSLIHDDLPAMDNDDYRRGKLTNHKVFGEAIAVLAGDALLNFAFETMLRYTLSKGTNIEAKVKAMEIIATASGTSGMIGGQVVDLESEGKEISGDELCYMHKCKTGALIKAPVLSAAVICGIGKRELAYLEDYSEKIGMAFQIKDDILDVEGSLATMGKNSGSDESNKKSTFITLFGLDQSRKMLNEYVEGAVQNMDKFGERAAFLKHLAVYIENRNN
jgi:geranylgeranyl diphosphate synthase type II